MKVLFAVNNDNVSEAIAQKYQKEYKEILSYKNVYYFNAIIRELQKDKNYDRIVISEDLEPFANNNYDMIDKFLFDKYNNISEEAKKINNERIEVILICADRRKRTEEILTKIYNAGIYNAGIYNAIIGQDRSIDEVCRLIYRPRNKTDARIYYNIQVSELSGQEDNENNVSEAEVENILAHYKRLGKNEDKYVDSFNNIIAQYTDIQLKIIIKYLPIHVKAVLEERSPKYQQLVTSGFSNMQDLNLDLKANKYKEKLRKKTEQRIEEKDDEEDVLIERKFTKPNITEPIIIPSDIKTENVKKVEIPEIKRVEIPKPEIVKTDEFFVKEKKEEERVEQEEQVEQPKRGRGRPRKNPLPEPNTNNQPKRGRGRPRKEENNQETTIDENSKNQEVAKKIDSDKVLDLEYAKEKEQDEEIDLFNIENKEEQNEEIDLFNIGNKEEQNEEIDLFNIGNKEEQNEEIDLFNIGNKEEQNEKVEIFNTQNNLNYSNNNVADEENNYITEKARVNITNNLRTLLTSEKKIVSFVGTTKNGTSFIVNNTAELLSSMGISTAILDMTKTKNAYYIYTNNEENLRNISLKCMKKLENGIAEGLKVNKNLTVYTEMPGEEVEYDIDKILSTLIQNYSAVLIDTDFTTSIEIFAKSQEIYLVQTMDVLTIQPLTAFLRNLKSKGVLKQEKLKIVINKSQRIRSLNIRTLIGGMSCYNAPDMTYMTELFDKDNIRYCEIPFEIQNYVKYLESLVNCSISLNGYTKLFISSLKELANMVYPLVNKQNYSSMNEMQKDPFSSKTSNILNKMRNKGY